MKKKDMTLEELIELQDNIKKRIEEYYNLLSNCTSHEYKKYEKLEEELHVLNEKMYEIQKLIMLKKEPIASSNKIDLRKYSKELKGRYLIFLHNTDIDISEIKYNGYHQLFGDMSYFIYKEEYRGHGYAYEALRLLSDLLQKNGIGDFWLAVEKKNIPSLKTIEKYGGQVVSDFGPDALLYECKALSIDLEESKIIKGGNYGRIK